MSLRVGAVTVPVRIYRVTVAGGSSLTEKGFEALDEACDAADLGSVLHYEAIDALMLAFREAHAPDFDDWNVTVEALEK
jgi:hypothetical protein